MAVLFGNGYQLWPEIAVSVRRGPALAKFVEDDASTGPASTAGLGRGATAYLITLNSVIVTTLLAAILIVVLVQVL
jgi:hypothetical protein